SLTKKKLLPAIQRIQSYKVIDIHADDEVNESDQNHIPFFKIDPKSLVNVVKERSLELLGQLGGVEGVVALVETDAENGIVDGVKNLSCRRNVFGGNTYLMKKPLKGFFYFMVEAFKDTTILIQLVCAVLSLDFKINKAGWTNRWYDGGSIYIVVFLIIGVSTVSNFKQSRQFEKMSKESANIKVDVVKDGRRQEVSIFIIVVRDVVCLKIGDQIPADGLFLSEYSLTVDESSNTGKGDHLDVNWSENLFLFSGIKVVNGYAQMLVTSVGNVYRENSGMAAEFCGSPTEKDLLSRAMFDLGINMEELKLNCGILHVENFNSEKKRNGISMRKKDDEKTIYVCRKGAAEMIVFMCSSYQDQTSVINYIDDTEKVIFNQIIQGMTFKSLRCIAFTYGKVGEGEFGYNDPQLLKKEGHMVAAIRDGTNDAPALKEADIGLSMGIQGTEVVKESSDIILDDNFTYVSAGEIPLTAVQMLWVNLIMDTLGALALAIERPTEDLMEKQPVGRSKPFITNIVWRNLISQVLYQVVMLLTLQFKGEAIFGVNEKVKDTLLFNTFVFRQVLTSSIQENWRRMYLREY
ncbi:hypothetical protein GIB67_019517, partial [Kingdonia uniflora]